MNKTKRTISPAECPNCGTERIRVKFPSAERWHCPPCSRERAKKSYKKTGGKAAKLYRLSHPELYKKALKKYRKTQKCKERNNKYFCSPKGQAIILYSRCHTRAKRLGLPFSLTSEFLITKLNEGKCEATGIPFEYKKGGRGPFSPSVDRINPEKGYTNKNCRVVCCSFNFAKGTWTDEDVIKMSKAFLSKISSCE